MKFEHLDGVRNAAMEQPHPNGSRAEVPGPWEYLYRTSSLHQAAAYAYLFRPTFVYWEDHLVLSERFDETHANEQLAAGHAAADVARRINRVHLVELFEVNEEPEDSEVFMWLATALCLSWNAVLVDRYRGARARFAVTGPPGNPQLTMTQEP